MTATRATSQTIESLRRPLPAARVGSAAPGTGLHAVSAAAAAPAVRPGGVTAAVAPRPTALVADPRPTSRLGICAVVEDAGFTVVAQVATAAEAVAAAVARRPDACVLDASIAGGGVQAARAIAARVPTAGAVVLAATASEEDVRGALRAGAAGYLPRSIGAARLGAALHAVAAGDVAIPRAMIEGLLRGEAPRPRRRAARLADRDVVLSSREWDVVVLLRRGLPTQEIGVELDISVVTVRRHLSEVRRKLGAPDRATALRLLEEAGTFTDVP
jgi:DNA-binding NarL/FixJ family response regulator